MLQEVLQAQVAGKGELVSSPHLAPGAVEHFAPDPSWTDTARPSLVARSQPPKQFCAAKQVG